MLEKFIEFRARGQLELGNQLVIFKGISGQQLSLNQLITVQRAKRATFTCIDPINRGEF